MGWPSPLLIRALTLIAIGLTIELALPVSLAIYPASSPSPPGATCAPFTVSNVSTDCAEAATVVAVWNAVGIGTVLLGLSWYAQWNRDEPRL